MLGPFEFGGPVRSHGPHVPGYGPGVLYRGIAKCQIGDGSIVLFWEDLCSSGVLAVKYPCLFSFAKAQRISVKSVVEAEDLASLFALPLSSQAYDELQDMKVELSMVHLSNDRKYI